MNTLTQSRLLKFVFIAALVTAALLIFNDNAFASLADDAQKGVDAVGAPNNSNSLGDTIADVVNFMLFAVGILSVIMVIVGGIRYVISAGDSGGTQSARNTILYAIVGLVVAFVAWGLVNFVTQMLS